MSPALSSSPEDFWHFLPHPHGEPPLSAAKDCLRLQAPVCEGWGGEGDELQGTSEVRGTASAFLIVFFGVHLPEHSSETDLAIYNLGA